MSNLVRVSMCAYHYVYKTTNLVNGMYYIGLHSANSLSNSYLGSGSYFKKALSQYGKTSFAKEILQVFSTREEASAYEELIVDADVVQDPNTYNLCLGGDYSGAKLIKRTEKEKQLNRLAHLGKTHTEATKEICRKLMIAEHENRRQLQSAYENIRASRNTETSKGKTRQQALRQWGDKDFREKTTARIKEVAGTAEFKTKSSYNAHRRWHTQGSIAKPSCRWCNGEIPNWDISHLIDERK